MDELEKLREQNDIFYSLSPKRRKFIEIYALTDSPYQAAIGAGYSKKSAYSTAYAILSDERARRAIELKREELRSKYEVNREYFVRHLKEIIEDKRFVKVADRISALSLLAKITGYIRETAPKAQQIVILKEEGIGEKLVEVSTEPSIVE